MELQKVIPLGKHHFVCRLLVLDVSFIELSSIDGAWKAFSEVPRHWVAVPQKKMV